MTEPTPDTPESEDTMSDRPRVTIPGYKVHTDDPDHGRGLTGPVHLILAEETPDTPESELTGDGRDDDRRIASTDYGAWVEVECTQVCGWKPEKQASSEAVRHFKATGHETAVKRHSSIHYHARRD